MSELEEGKHAGEFLLTEFPGGTLSRDNVTVTVPAATTLPAGAVLVQGGSTWAPMTAETTIEGAVVGILYGPLTNKGVSPASMAGVVIDRFAEVRGGDLDWNGCAGSVQDDAIDLLAAAGVIVRDYTPSGS
jgi:hypothetical protein